MKITKEWLKHKNACTQGYSWFKENYPDGGEHVEVISNLMAENCHHWANWCIVRLMKHSQQIKYAIYAAELVLEIYEIKNPYDNRPRKAIDAAKEYLNNPTRQNKITAARAAYAADYAAYAAAYAARAAAAAAAYAAYAADAADYAAAYAARAADAADYAADAAAAEIYKNIIEYGLKLLEGEN